MAGQKDYNYSNNDSPYNDLLTREGDLTYQFGGQTPPGGGRQSGGKQVYGSGNDDGTTQTPGGSVATVALKSAGNASDVWIQNFIRSVNWKPKTVGFYINGQSGYAEFANIYVSGTIVVSTGSVGGFDIGEDYIRDHLNTMGMASTVSGANDVRFWAGATFANRNTAPFRVYEDGSLFASSGNISGSALDPGSVTYTELAHPPLNGVTDPIVTPTGIGQTYVNTALGRCFMAIGTTDSNDWVLLESARLPREHSAFDLVTVTDVITTIKVVQMKPSVFDLVTITEDFSANIV